MHAAIGDRSSYRFSIAHDRREPLSASNTTIPGFSGRVVTVKGCPCADEIVVRAEPGRNFLPPAKSTGRIGGTSTFAAAA